MKKKLLGSIGIGVVAVSMVFGGATAANAGWGHSVGGGTWNYFLDYNANWNASEYYHGTATHRASVENSGGTKRVIKAAGLWANAYQDLRLWGNKAYWYKY